MCVLFIVWRDYCYVTSCQLSLYLSLYIYYLTVYLYFMLWYKQVTIRAYVTSVLQVVQIHSIQFPQDVYVLDLWLPASATFCLRFYVICTIIIIWHVANKLNLNIRDGGGGGGC